MLFLLFVLSCISEHGIAYEIVKEVQVTVYDTAYVEVEVPVEVEVEVEVEVPEQYPLWVQSVVQPKLANGIDILWVVDPSGSMMDDMPRVVDGVAQMMAALPTNIFWRLEIISTDRLVNANMSSFPLLPGDSASDAQSSLNNNVSGHREGGLESVHKFTTENIDALQWLRHDAALLIVFVSDENDHSHPASSINDPTSFISWVQNYRETVYVTAIVNQDVSISECPSQFNPNLDVGIAYMDVANYFGGVIIDICAEDWSQGVAQASSQLQLVDEIKLDYVPVSDQHIEVFVRGVIWNDWIYDATSNTIFFTVTPTEDSLIEVVYNYQ